MAERPRRNGCSSRGHEPSSHRSHEAQFTGPVHVGLVELALTTGRIERRRRGGGGRHRTVEPDRRPLLPDASCVAIGARAEADRAELARAGRDDGDGGRGRGRRGRRIATKLDGWVAEIARSGRVTAGTSPRMRR